MAGIFSQIAEGKIPCYKVAEERDYLAFLDIHPLAKGHTLAIPKKEVDYLFDLDDATYAGLMAFAKNVSLAILSTIPAKRISVHVIGLEVPHAHIHLIPINSMKDCNFANPKLKFSEQEYRSTAEAISAAYGKG
jgi:histidine triad (HIT) family protein